MNDLLKPHVHLDLFAGPLDLLLHLIEQQRLDITAYSLAQVTDQYMAALRADATPEPATIAEFLVIGAKLLVIKTRALLPRSPLDHPADDSEDLGEQLARQLIDYQRFKQAAQQLRDREQDFRSFGRPAVPPPPPVAEPAALDIDLQMLVVAMQRRLQLMLPLEEPPLGLPQPKIITLAEMRVRIWTVLTRQRWTTFEDLLSLAISRNEIIVTLWTVLELLKRQQIVVEQPHNFGTITVGRGPLFDSNAQPTDIDPAPTAPS